MATEYVRADNAFNDWLNVTQADLRGLMHEDESDCVCQYAWNGDSALNMDPRSHSAHTELDEIVTHVTGYDTFDDWLERHRVEIGG
jgi:hypothetical protein